ncbi:hypothetical protein BOTBODRAFT_57461 [Botryobasidium botryosum FD-172 SS1]|uniref:Mug135-like C-terminal domain-containing protein n=1 Tax=Botryobasidium botryosum (strain FD-172 SS1) TaxID=930990 RepID=A0A067M9I5_BOTB1|nr:hypothetical protein BOTBODRAFT_57461 [Botryobasidium botryosum FD-172 SS1]
MDVNHDQDTVSPSAAAQITSAILRTNILLASHTSGLPGAATQEQVAAAEVEKTSLAIAAAPPSHPPPAWAQAFFDAVDAKFAQIQVLLQQNHNALRGAGVPVPYHIVPLADGTFPTDKLRPNGEQYPPILNDHTLRTIDEATVDDYLDLYGVKFEPEPDAGPDAGPDFLLLKRLRLGQAIGVTFQV